MQPDLIISPTSGLKMVDAGLSGPLVMEGPLVLFTSADDTDLEGDFFTKATDYGPLSDTGEATVAAYYNHGLDSEIGRERIGSAVLKMTDAGIWARYQITRRKEYLRMLAEADQDPETQKVLGGAGVLGQSSGALMHTFAFESMQTKAGKPARWIKSWTIGEASPTPEPAEPRTSVLPIKSLHQPDALKSLQQIRDELTFLTALRATRRAFLA